MKLEQYVSIAEKERVFRDKERHMHYDRIVTPNDFDNWYAEMIQIKDRIYRGVNEASYKNYTSAQRLYFIRELLNYNIEDVIVEQINNLRSSNNNLMEKYCDALGIPCSDLFIMSMAQHHKDSISPLIDFSTDVNTALYFMQKGAEFPKYGVGVGDGNDIENYMSIYSVPTSYFKSVEKDLAFRTWILDGLCNTEVVTTDKSYIKTTVDLIERERQYESLILEEINNYILEEFSFENMSNSATNYYIPLKAEIPHKNISIKLTSCNLNMVAQDGCFIFHNNGIDPLEENLSCVDIHKSLTPYIIKKYLLPNSKTDEAMFPIIDQITSASIFDALANLRTKE